MGGEERAEESLCLVPFMYHPLPRALSALGDALSLEKSPRGSKPNLETSQLFPDGQFVGGPTYRALCFPDHVRRRVGVARRDHFSRYRGVASLGIATTAPRAPLLPALHPSLSRVLPHYSLSLPATPPTFCQTRISATGLS